MTKLSVIIPTYNRADLIAETLRAMLCQSRPPDEIIVVDDGSEDNTREVVTGLDSTVRLVRQENTGPAAARNRGLQEATGDFVQFFDSDDLPAYNKLEVQLDALVRSDAEIAYCPWVKARLANGVARCEPFVIQQLPLPKGKRPSKVFIRAWVTVFQTCLFRRSVLERVGPFDPRLMIAEDSELLFRLLMANARLVHTPNTIVLYRLHEANQISGSALPASRWADDWALYKSIVNDRVQQDVDTFGIVERAIWAAETAKAQRTATSLRAEVPGAGPVASAISAADRFRRKWARRLAHKRMAIEYGEGPMRDEQRVMIHELGYSVGCL